MFAVKPRMAAACFVLGMIAVSLLAATAVMAQDPAIDPEATSALKKMTDYIGGLEAFSMDTYNMLEEVLDSGQKIQFSFASAVTIKRPNQLRAERVSESTDQMVVYDGKTISIYNAGDNYYAEAEAPDNLDDALHFARESLGMVPPSGDMVFSNAYELLTANITSAGMVGASWVNGVKCVHLAFRSPLVDWQIWIADGDRPLPYKYVLTTMDDPAFPQYIVLIDNWETSAKVDDGFFEFEAPEGAIEIDFIRAESNDGSNR